ncbi:MAG: RHS repeat-associated core domain-containing protein [Phycisphaerae bacterium]
MSSYNYNLACAFGFAGMRYEKDADIYLTPNRAYSPTIGRWLQPDPLGTLPNAKQGNRFAPTSQYTDGRNLYEYCAGDPVNERDTWGLKIKCGPEIWIWTGHWCVDEEVWGNLMDEAALTIYDTIHPFSPVGGQCCLRKEPIWKAGYNSYFGCVIAMLDLPNEISSAAAGKALEILIKKYGKKEVAKLLFGMPVKIGDGLAKTFLLLNACETCSREVCVKYGVFNRCHKCVERNKR